MKSLKVLLFSILSFTTTVSAWSLPTCAVLDIDTEGAILNSESAGDLTRRELNKLGIYHVSFKHDMKPALEAIGLNNHCFDINCLVKAGEALNVSYMLSGYIEFINDRCYISYRLIDVANGNVIKSHSREFLPIKDEVESMIQITLQEMFGLAIDTRVLNLLTNKAAREGLQNNIPSDEPKRLNLSGTRMGFVTIFGSNAEILSAPRSQGGFDAMPYMFQFGYQFETQYLNQGRLQGLFEFIPSITGIEQGLFIPSLTVLHGLRDNKSGFEFAFGPTFGLSTMAEGYYDENGDWKLKSEIDSTTGPVYYEMRLDSRGETEFTTGFLLAVGLSMKSGSLNIPVNVYSVLQKNNQRVGLSIGINGKR